MKIDAWWFNNTQTAEDALYQIPGVPDLTPQTHLGIYAEGGTLEYPIRLEVSATAGSKVLYENQLVFTDETSNSDDCAISVYIKADGSILDCKIAADTLPVLPDNINVEIKSGGSVYSANIACEYATLSGKITNFSGNPFPSPAVFAKTGFENNQQLPFMWVWSRKDGTYSITVPKGHYHHFYVDDNTYGTSTLENWSWHMIVDRDETHDFKVGTGEVYSLCAWANNGGFSTLFIYFRPMILKTAGKYQVEINGNAYNIEDISPSLNLEDMYVTINGYELEQLSLQRIYETGTGGAIMPAYVLQAKRYPNSREYSTVGKQTLIVEYNTVDKNGDTAQSQGRTQFYYSNAYALSL